MLEDHGPVLGLDHEPDVEEPSGELGVAGLGLRDHVRVPLLREPPEVIGLGPGDVDRALPRVGLVIEVEHLVGESLQAALGDADQPHRKVHARQPGRGLDHVRDVLEIPADLLAPADPAHRRDQSDGLVGLDHGTLLSLVASDSSRQSQPGARRRHATLRGGQALHGDHRGVVDLRAMGKILTAASIRRTASAAPAAPRSVAARRSSPNRSAWPTVSMTPSV